ncbi:MAG: sporulation initiation factor Spo0A C-terminal domain-containing protein [Lachnospiraceae bacterium]|nr:sporulation initiation factor Spo0A C-terminal domain-containing protein [Lachnospiraceae bacterium]
MITEDRADILRREAVLEETTLLFRELGVPVNLRGYWYLRDAVLLSVEDIRVLNSVTGVLYPAIAQKYQASVSRVERASRHAIETAWDRGRSDVMDEIFGYTIKSSRGRPTNSEFIATIADWVRIRCC